MRLFILQSNVSECAFIITSMQRFMYQMGCGQMQIINEYIPSDVVRLFRLFQVGVRE